MLSSDWVPVKKHALIRRDATIGLSQSVGRLAGWFIVPPLSNLIAQGAVPRVFVLLRRKAKEPKASAEKVVKDIRRAKCKRRSA